MLRSVLSICLSSFIALNAFAQSDAPAFMTARDVLQNATSSNLNLRNNSNRMATVYGLYVRQYAYVTPGQSCSSATVIFPASQNTTAGAFVTPLTIPAGQSAAIGKNYLYNLIYSTIYYENIAITPPSICALPGCTWGSDTTQYEWCIYLGALAPVSTSPGYTSNVPPAASAASGGGYNYNLINSYVYLGPISCNDQTLTCSVSNQQTQLLN